MTKEEVYLLEDMRQVYIRYIEDEIDKVKALNVWATYTGVSGMSGKLYEDVGKGLYKVRDEVIEKMKQLPIQANYLVRKLNEER